MVFMGNEDFLRRARVLSVDAPELKGDRPAGVLVPVVERDNGFTLLFTVRGDQLPVHAGQISFPGGKLRKGESPQIAALRETQEETGVTAQFVKPLGFLDLRVTSTGFVIAPLVAVLRPGFVLQPCPDEVAEIFEAPLDFFMDPANHLRRGSWEMPWQGRNIWGATAGILRNMWERLYD